MTTDRPGPLSPRQLECLRLVADGYSYAQIAEQLDLGKPTINGYVHEIRRQLGARTTAHAVAIGYRTGLLSQPLSDEAAVVGLAHTMGYRIALVRQ